jgi:hypothetical protein
MKKIFLLAVIPVFFCANCKKESDRSIDNSYQPDVSPSKFTASTTITNPYFPALVGKKYSYEGQSPDGLERVEEQRLATTKIILGITCIIIHVKEYLNGTLTEETFDWYAQDNSGNVWYFGEAVDNYNPNGTIKNHSGSWEAGVDGAKPGLIMPANPQVGFKYREEYYFNHAEDEAEITALGLTVTVPAGTYNNCIKTRNWTALEPQAIENKYYAPGIGLLKEENITEGFEIRLISVL